LAEHVQFLHAADLHLGSPLQSLGNRSPELRGILETASYTALQRLTAAAIRQAVDFVVFAGDIYDQEIRSVAANQHFIHSMHQLNQAGIPVYIVYGNHDPLDERREYFAFPDNVRVFPADRVHLEEVQGQGGRLVARVLGQSYRSRTDNRRMYELFNPPDRDVFNIGLLHTGLNPSSGRYVPCSIGDLKSKNAIHYWALGHLHRRTVLGTGYPAVAFPGTIQGRDLGETGCGGCLLVRLASSREADILFIPTAPVIWLTRQVEINPEDENMDDLRERLLEEGQRIRENDPAGELEMQLAPGEKVQVEGYIVRWELTGRGPVHRDLITRDEEGTADYLTAALRAALGNLRPFLWTDSVRFSTASPLPREAVLSREDTVLQHLQEVFREMMAGENRQEVREIMGEIWFEQVDHEDNRDFQLPLTAETVNRVAEKAYNLVVERLMEGREQP